MSDGRLTSLNELASINLLDMLNFKLSKVQVVRILESDTDYKLNFSNTGYALVNKESGLIRSVYQPAFSGLPYSMIEYESYGEIEGYILPRKITIFSADGESKVLFRIRSLEINPKNLTLTISHLGRLLWF